ncbi:YozE family protein [Micromonospora sp. NPDC050695]|uniref:YozE family protein n=1 Tax=Micromonospora sp. NPDC050695 TaxID=3154938 RepID=UPI0033E67077
MSPRIITADDLAQVLDAHPTLNTNGYDHPGFGPSDDWAASRRQLANRLDEVQAAYDWITTLRRCRITRDTATSYGLKHEGEQAGIGYVTNGAFIAAAYLAGVTVKAKRGEANPQIGVTTAPYRPKPAKGSFAAWLGEQTDARHPIGDLARDAADDDTWPTSGDYPTYVNYLNGLHAAPVVLETLREAWTEYAGADPGDPYGDED